MKIVINRCFGGFGVSKAFIEKWNALYPDAADTKGYGFMFDTPTFRTSPAVIELIEQMGEDAYGDYAELRVVELPDNMTDYRLMEYDGAETILAVVDGKIVEYA